MADVKTTKKKQSPSSVLDMIMAAIRQQPATANGVSRMAVAKYLKSEMDWDNSSKLKQALKKGVESGKLVQSGQSFRVAGDPVIVQPPEAAVQIVDISIGKGPEAVKGDTVVMKYEGKLVSDESVFDASSSFEFTLGAGDVIKGWDQGILGMRVGGQRKLEVPATLGYGKRGAAPEIPPNADLIFTVSMKKIK